MKNKIKIGITIGDLNGIGPEVILKTLQNVSIFNNANFIIFSSFSLIKDYINIFGLNLRVNEIQDIENIKDGINVLNVWKEKVEINLGTPTNISGQYSLKSLENATESLLKSKIDCLITAPIDKDNISKSGFNFKGHTEYLEDKLQEKSMMLMCYKKLRIGLITNHLPVKDISKNINSELIKNKIGILREVLKSDFGIKYPKIAILGLNPHNGDGGILGTEENDIINPIIYKEDNLFGPFSADGFFSSDNYRNYDAIIAMYHDQGLIPFKILSKGRGVNFTAGLSKLRSSPAHGTAYDIAKSNKASESSFLEAVKLIISIYKKKY